MIEKIKQNKNILYNILPIYQLPVEIYWNWNEMDSNARIK